MDDGVHSESEGERKWMKYSLYGRHTHKNEKCFITCKNSKEQLFVSVVSTCSFYMLIIDQIK